MLFSASCIALAETKSDAESGRWEESASQIEQSMRAEHIPGVAVAVIASGKTAWARGFGYADLELRRLVTTDTIFTLASVSKTVTALAMMQAVEQGSLSLDESVNVHLPFEVTHPDFPDRPITARQLATHTSGIVDNDAIYDDPINYHSNGDNPLALGEFLRRYLRAGDMYYSSQSNFSRSSPGSRWQYSNIGAALAGYLVESATATPFDVYCRRHIFAPLQMHSTGWHLSEIDTARLTVAYAETDGTFQAYPPYGLATWPDGGLRTTVKDLARFLAMIMQGGVIEGERVAAPATIAAMFESQGASATSKRFPGKTMPQGIFWYRVFDGKGRATFWGHWGSDPGVVTVMAFDPNRQIGAIVLSNVDANASRAAALQAILDRLIEG
jgi:CubicO group peptidase (beta-lactamase class C family)